MACGSQRAREFMQLLKAIPERDPATFFAFDAEQVGVILDKPDTVCVIDYEDGEPIAGGLMWRPAPDDPPCLLKEHEGGEIGLEPGTYWQVDNTVVIPSCRGRSLQQKVVNELLGHAEGMVVATVSPENPASYKSLFNCGFEEKLRVKRHEGYERLVVALVR